MINFPHQKRYPITAARNLQRSYSNGKLYPSFPLEYVMVTAILFCHFPGTFTGRNFSDLNLNVVVHIFAPSGDPAWEVQSDGIFSRNPSLG